MNTTNTTNELFSRDFYVALKKSWLAYIKQEVHVAPEYFLFYALVKDKNPVKVFTPLIDPKKVEQNGGPWNALEHAIATVSSNLKMSAQSGKYTFVGSQTNRQYDAATRKWTFDQTNYDIALTPEQVSYLNDRLLDAQNSIKSKELYAHFLEVAEKAKARAHAKRISKPKLPLQECCVMWEKGEIGPDCFCGNPTVVMFRTEENNAEPFLMCLFHTKAEGAMFSLPVDKHPNWPNLTGETLVEYMKTAPKFHDDDEEEE